MAHVDVPKDLNGIRTTFAFGMSGKQLIMLSAGAVAAIALTALLRGGFGLTLFSSFLISAIPTLAPVAFCAFYKKNGMTFFQIAKIVLRHSVRSKGVRLYRTRNFYFQLAKFKNVPNSSSNNRREGLNAENATQKSARQTAVHSKKN